MINKSKYTNAVIGAIFENLKHLEIIFEPTHKSFVKDTKNTGDSKEVSVQDFLMSFFPTTYHFSKGKIYSLDGETNEIDCVIKAPNHPKLLTPKREVIISEGVYAAIEVKPDISTLTEKSEFHRALNQIKSVKNLKRDLPTLFTEGEVPDAVKKIPCVIFSKKSRELDDVINYLKTNIKNKLFKKDELPDVIFSLDKGIIFHSLHIEKTIYSDWVKQQSLIHTGEKYISLYSKNKESLLGLFILILLCVKSPEPTMSDFILKDYIKFGLPQYISFKVIEP